MADRKSGHLGPIIRGIRLAMEASGGRTAVSLTPLSLDHDSRTFRIARSLAEMGWYSLVIEGDASTRRFWGDEIEVRSLADPVHARKSPGGRTGIVPRLRAGSMGLGGELALYTAYRGYAWWRHYRRPLGVIPRADLYYLHSFELHRAIAGRGVPIIYDAHDFYRGIEPPERQSSFDRNLLRPALNRREDQLVASAAAMVTVSDGVAGLMEKTFNRRPAVIRNCHDERLDRAVEPDLRTRLGLSPTDRLCVVVGNRKPGMAVDAAVEALTMLPGHFHLAFVGRFYEADRDRARAHPDAARLHFGHCVLPNEVVPFIRTADLGLIIYEPYSENYRFALPNGFFQIVAAGLPVVRGHLPEIEAAIGGRSLGLCVEHLDAQELAAAIIHCIREAPRLRAASTNLACELRWEREASRLHCLVETVLRRRAPTHCAALPSV